jgi:hypothetical protein
MTLRNRPPGAGVDPSHQEGETGPMRGLLLWFVGIPIPIIILLYVFHVI